MEGRYRVVRVIGVGGTGVVHEVEHVVTGQRLALKTLIDQQHAPRLEQEGRALARLRSPHVVKVVDLGSSQAGPYLVMTLLEGRNLRDLIEKRGKLSLRIVANLTLQICEALDEAHRAGLVHRDLKPDNMHLGGSNDDPDDLCHVTVFDFGVVKFASTEANSALTRTGSTVGTPYYMSLEQLRGSGTVDVQSDVYAFCVVLYECLAGLRPFEAGTLGDLIYAICSTSPAALSSVRPDVPREVSDAIMSGLSRDKPTRPKDMRELAKVFAPHADPGFTLWLRRDPTAPLPPPSPAKGAALVAGTIASPETNDPPTLQQEVPAAIATPIPAPRPRAPTPATDIAAPPVAPPSAPRIGAPATPAAAASAASPATTSSPPHPPRPAIARPTTKMAPPRAPGSPGVGLTMPLPPSSGSTPLPSSAFQPGGAGAPGGRAPAPTPPIGPLAATEATRVASLKEDQLAADEKLLAESHTDGDGMLDAQMRGRDEARANALSDTQSGHELPDDASTGEGPVVTDRDTPTEMFVRDVHGDLIETDSTPGDATKATVVAGFSAPSTNGPAAAGSTDFSTMALPATSFGVPGVPVDPASRLDSADTTAILDLPSSGGARTIPNARTSSPQLMTDSGSHSAFRSSGAPTGGSPLIAAAPAFGPMPAGLERPTFQAKLDRALANVGQTGNRAALRILARFRGASPEQQIIIVIVAAASLAFIAVIALWLILA